jgi:hypothetical protein
MQLVTSEYKCTIIGNLKKTQLLSETESQNLNVETKS